MFVRADFLRTPSRIPRRNPRKIASPFSSTVEPSAKSKTWRGAGHDATRDARAVRLQCLGQSSFAGRGDQLDCGKIRSADGLELWFRARHAGAYFRRRVDMAGTLPGPVACITAGYDAVQGRGELAGALERARSAPAWFCARADAIRPGPRHGVQDAEVRRLPQSALGIDAASRQSRDVPSRAGHNPSAAAWRAAGPDRPDALLSRTIHRGGRVVYGTVPTLS